MASRKTPGAAAAQRSSMESFLDDYQMIRLALGVAGTALVFGIMSFSGWQRDYTLYFVVLAVITFHALWCRLQRIRSPRPMLFLDLTLWGLVMVVNSDAPLVNPPSLAFLCALTVLFADGVWRAGFIAYITAWFTVSYLRTGPLTTDSIVFYLSILLTVGALAALVIRVRSWLGRLDANRSQMLGTVSHELRNNLTGMLGLTELVATQDDMSPEEVKELLGLAHQQALDATEIVEDLLTVTRLERSMLTVESQPVDVNREVETTARRFVGAGTAVSVQTVEGLPPASGDPLRVRQILRNLVSNAVRYGGSAIRISTRAVDGHVQVVVADNGEGVPAEDVATIFLPYRRSTTGRRDASSIGLGLWICRQLAHAMGGSLEYQRVDESTLFILTLRAHNAGQAGETRERVGATAGFPAASPSEGSMTPAVAV